MAPAIAKVTTKRAIVEARANSTVTRNYCHIDDLTQVTVHKARGQAEREAAKAGTAIIESLLKREVVISSKSRLVANRRELAHAVAKRIRSEAGVTIKVEGSFTDVGADLVAGAKKISQRAKQPHKEGNDVRQESRHTRGVC